MSQSTRSTSWPRRSSATTTVKRPNYSYFDGCSDGGREAMEVAERYPTDFNGIIAGAPEIIAGPLNAELQTWDYRVNTDARRQRDPHLGEAAGAAQRGHRPRVPAMTACPATGSSPTRATAISTSRASQCPAGTDNASCLTPAQVTVADEIYSGAGRPAGTPPLPGRLRLRLRGARGAASRSAAGRHSGPRCRPRRRSSTAGLSLPYLRYQYLPPGQLGPDPASGASATGPSARCSRWPTPTTRWTPTSGVPPPRRQADHLAGVGRPGHPAVRDDRLLRHAGQPHGRAELDPAVRADVPVPDGRALRRAVTPPQLRPRLPDGPVGGGRNRAELRSPPPTRSVGTTLTRPVYPYPLVPKYNGAGATDDASSFHPVVSPHAHDYSQWIGNDLFYQPVNASDGSHGDTGGVATHKTLTSSSSAPATTAWSRRRCWRAPATASWCWSAPATSGGAAVSARPFPGVDARMSRYSYLVSLFPQALLRELGVDVELRRRAISSYTPRGDAGRPDLRRRGATRASLRRTLGERDGDGADGAGALRRAHRGGRPARRSRRSPSRCARARSCGAGRRRRGLGRRCSSARCRELLERQLRLDLVRGIVATDALIGTFAALDDPGLAQNRCFLYHVIGNGTGRWDVPVGGMGALTGRAGRRGPARRGASCASARR